MYLCIHFSLKPLRVNGFSAAPISGPPGVDAVVSRPHGGHHRNASTEELDHQVVGGGVMAGDRRYRSPEIVAQRYVTNAPKMWFLGMLSDASRGQ